MKQDIDPITFEVIRNALSAIADEMAIAFMRSAYSQVVRDTLDYSTALCDRKGKVIAEGLSLAVQLGSFPEMLRRIIAKYGDDMDPGDVFIANDPYGSGGQHLPDIYVIKPIFVGHVLHGYAATLAHHSDVGGLTPGSVAIHATDLHQEGLRIPILKLYEGGYPNRTLFEIIEKNTRTPIQVLGDLRAHLAACRIGENGFAELVQKHGLERLEVYLEALQDEAEACMRATIASIPDGIYKCTDYIDGVGDTPEPLPVVVSAIVSGDSIVLDFSGTAGQVEAAINCPVAMIRSASYCAIRCLAQDDIPNCEGYIRPITIQAPEGTLVNPREPAACGARGVVGYRVFDAIMGALSQAVPGQVIAGCEGGPTLFSVGGTHESVPFVLTEVLVSTWGARATKDGLEGVSNPAANLSNCPVELLEAELPLQVTSYGLVPDTGGPGRWRGGLASVREFRFLADRAEFTVRNDRRDHPPYGLMGGRPGASSRNVLVTPDGEEQLIAVMPMRSHRMLPGDIFRLVSAGGGGYGNPMERDPELVLFDVHEGKVSVDAAQREYGVVIDPGKLTIDINATDLLRAEGGQ